VHIYVQVKCLKCNSLSFVRLNCDSCIIHVLSLIYNYISKGVESKTFYLFFIFDIFQYCNKNKSFPILGFCRTQKQKGLEQLTVNLELSSSTLTPINNLGMISKVKLGRYQLLARIRICDRYW